MSNLLEKLHQKSVCEDLTLKSKNEKLYKSLKEVFI